MSITTTRFHIASLQPCNCLSWAGVERLSGKEEEGFSWVHCGIRSAVVRQTDLELNIKGTMVIVVG
jgi:hypothetical protein